MRSLTASAFFFAMGLAVCAEDVARPVSAWLQETKEASAQPMDSAERAVLIAAALQDNSKIQGISCDAKALEEWLAGQGGAIQKKLLTGEPLTPEEAPHRFGALALLLRQAHHQLKGGKLPKEKLESLSEEQSQLLALYKRTHEKGMAAMKKGYATGMLTPEEYAAVRDYAISVEVRGTSSSFTPSDFKISSPGLELGKPAPLFSALKLESVPTPEMGSTDNIYDTLTPRGVLWSCFNCSMATNHPGMAWCRGKR